MPKIQTTKIYSDCQESYDDPNISTLSEQGSSRCFAAGTLIRMYNGRLKPVEQIVAGDKVMNIEGNGYNTVIETHSGIDEMFCVHQAKGIDYTVNSRHILATRQTRAKLRKVAIEGFKSAEKRRVEMLPYDRSIIHDFEVKEYASLSRNVQLRYSGFKRTLIQLPDNNLPIDPYYLGMWLGDGCSARPYEITNIDKEIIDYFYEFASYLDTYALPIDKVSHRMQVCEEGTHNLRKKGAIRLFCDHFRSLNLIKNKHIPEQYIYTTLENRLKLLAGLIDTDGCTTGRNTFEISQKNERIIDAIIEICHISGFYTNGKRSKTATMKRKDGSKYSCKVYSVEINHSDFKELNKYIKLPRKRINKSCDRDYFVSSLSIEPVGIGEFYGFTLDNSPYFLLEDGTVCHNSGKTWNTVLWLIVHCMQVPNTTVSIVRQTLPALKRSVFRDFKDNMLNLQLWDDHAINRSDFIYTFPNGSWIEFFSADNEQKLRGSKRKILYVNEGNELTFIEWQQLQMRTTEFSIIDYNPSFTDEHWLCTLNSDPRTKHIISTYKGNPFLEQKVIDEIESLQWKNPSLWRVYGLGLQAIIEGLIFEKIEIVEEIPRWAKKHRYLGMDFGYTNDPTAIEEVCLFDDIIYIDEVCYQTKMLTNDIIDTLKERNAKEHFNFEVISESADPRMVDEIGNAGIDIKAVQKYPGSVMAGLTKMMEYRICITRRSVNVIREFKNYTYRQNKEGKWLNEPIDCFNHCFTGDTLIRTAAGQKRIDSIREGELVATSSGFRQVGKLFRYRWQKICEFKLNFGNFAIVIKATPDHYVKTDKGWKQIQYLCKGETIYLFNTSTTRLTTCTKENDTIQEAQSACTSQFGNTIMEQSQKAFMCITKTEIQPTTASKTSNCYQKQSILKSIKKSFASARNTLNNGAKTWTASDLLQRLGMLPKKAENGILYTLKTLFSRLLLVHVSSAERSTRQRSQKALTSAPIIAKQNTGEIAESIMRLEHASNVEENLQPINTQKQSFAVAHVLEDITVLSESNADVYDLHVDGKHEYFANDILVHNCIDGIRYVIIEKVLGGYGEGLTAEEFADLI